MPERASARRRPGARRRIKPASGTAAGTPPGRAARATKRCMAARLIAAGMNDQRDELNPLIAMTDSLVDIALGALREWAKLRGTTVEACLMDLMDDE
jgi:hypothetical protein